MSSKAPPKGLEPISQGEQQSPQPKLPPKKHGIFLYVRGRRIQLQALTAAPKGILFWLSILGPGLISGAVSNDAGSIATYSQAGAQFGYDLLWVLVLITISLAIVQEMSARLGAATGRGLLALIRSHFGIGWTMVACVIVIIANFGLVLGEFVGISSGLELFGISKYISVPITALFISYLVLGGSYNRVEKIFLIMAAVFLTYPLAAILAHPSLNGVLHGAFVPGLHKDPGYVTLIVGLIGTTISPYQQIFQQSAVVEKGIPRRRYWPERMDTYVGMIFSQVVSIFIIIATAATLHKVGIINVNTAADAAKALQPIAGNAAKILFGIGIVGASLIAASLIPISSSFAFTEAFGLPKGLGLSYRRARAFYIIFLAQVILGAVLALIPDIPAFQLLILVQVLNGILLPIILVFIMLLINDARLMGDLINTRLYNVVGWGTIALITLAILFDFAQQFLPVIGIHFLNG